LERYLKSKENSYLELILEPIRTCANYKPKFGQGGGDGLTLTEFQRLYKNDSFYNWIGLNNPMMYAAHKAAGGITSVYRQLGIGCERLFRTIIRDAFELSSSDVKWSYDIQTSGGKSRTFYLDGRISLEKIKNTNHRRLFHDWMKQSAQGMDINSKVFATLTGTVFEVRQGYKSKDSKRQNADIANAATAYTNAYMPCAVIFSQQIDEGILLRYKHEKWVVLTGVEGLNNPLISTYDFMRDIIGYDLASFFKRNSKKIKSEINTVLKTLLTAGGK